MSVATVHLSNIYMLFVLKMLPEAAGRGQNFEARGHSLLLYGPTLSRQITYLFFYTS